MLPRIFSPRLSQGRFVNYNGECHNKMFWRAIRSFFWLIFSRNKQFKKELDQWVQPQAVLPQPPHLTWLGHASFLIRTKSLSLITDPVFGRLSIIFRRIIAPVIELKDIPPLDVVLLSHNHRDHMDEPALRFLQKQYNPLFLVPLGDGPWFARRNFKRVIEFTWGQQYTTHDGTLLTFLPSQHWSQRGFFDRNCSLWGSWMIELPQPQHTIYFAGDTAYGDHFSKIASVFSSIDTVLMPIGPSEPDSLLRDTHVNAEEAAQAFLELQAKTLIPMHWGTYRLGTEHPLEPLWRLQQWWNTMKPEGKELLCMKFGQSQEITQSLTQRLVSINPQINVQTL